jgi:hypothetical protein
MNKPATPTKPHRRTPLAAAGATLLGLSLLLTAAPALGAADHGGSTTSANGSNGGGGGSGNVKVHDAATGLETSGTDNEPHVCDFWLEFDFADSHEAGAWSVVSIAPTGDGSTVALGTYDTAGDGTDASSVIVVSAGHYRVEWATTGTTTTKKKTFWVEGGCHETAAPAEESQAEEVAPPSDDPAPPADESPAEEVAPPSDDPSPPEDSPAEDPAPPSDEPATPQDEQLASSVEETVVEDSAPLVDETVGDELAPPLDEPVEEDLAPPLDETAVDELAPPLGETAVEDAVEAQDAGSTGAESPPDQDQLGGTAVAGGPTMPDTALPTPSAPAGVLGSLGLLLLILFADVTGRRHLHAERD